VIWATLLPATLSQPQDRLNRRGPLRIYPAGEFCSELSTESTSTITGAQEGVLLESSDYIDTISGCRGSVPEYSRMLWDGWWTSIAVQVYGVAEICPAPFWKLEHSILIHT